MQKRHTDSLRYLNEQIPSTQKYIVPFGISIERFERLIKKNRCVQLP